MAFDPGTGDLVDPDFIPSDPDNLGTPINAILSASGDSILLSDQIEDVVHEYALDGTYLGVFAPAGGPDPTVLDNVRGIALRDNGNLLVTTAPSGTTGYVAEFDTAGNYLGNFIEVGSGGLNSPFDIYHYMIDWLVSAINSDNILRYDELGEFIEVFAPVNPFPEQITEASNSNVLVANFSGDEEGIMEFLQDGTLVDIYNPANLGGYRGVYELDNGNLLVTTGTGVHEITRTGVFVESKITDVSARASSRFTSRAATPHPRPPRRRRSP